MFVCFWWLLRDDKIQRAVGLIVKSQRKSYDLTNVLWILIWLRISHRQEKKSLFKTRSRCCETFRFTCFYVLKFIQVLSRICFFFLACKTYAKTKCKIHARFKIELFNFVASSHQFLIRIFFFTHLKRINLYKTRASVGQQPSKKFDSHVLLLRPLSASLSLEFRLPAACSINLWKCLLFYLCNQGTSGLHIYLNRR